MRCGVVTRKHGMVMGNSDHHLNQEKGLQRMFIFTKYLLRISVSSFENTEMNKTDTRTCLPRAYGVVGQTEKQGKQIWINAQRGLGGL